MDLREDIIGNTFNFLTVLNYIGARKSKHIYKCLCKCNSITKVEKYNLIKGRIKSCGCLRKIKNTNDIIGKTFGLLTILSYSRQDNKHYYECSCECGSIVKILRNNLIGRKSIKSCGCSKKTIDINDIIGKTFGKLTVEDYSRYDTNNYRHFYKCSCSCGTVKEIERLSLLVSHTKSCGCNNYQTGASNKDWTGYEDISGTLWSRIVYGAKDRNIQLSITIGDAWMQYKKQNGKCALTDLPLKIDARSDSECDRTASLDRIDNEKGYEKNNIQWVHKDINWMKGKFKVERFIELCKLVAKKTN